MTATNPNSLSMVNFVPMFPCTILSVIMEKSSTQRYILIQRFPSGTSRHSDELVPDNYVNEKGIIMSSHFDFIDLYVVDGSFFFKEDFLNGEGKVHRLQSLL